MHSSSRQSTFLVEVVHVVRLTAARSVKYSWLTIGMLFFIGLLYFASAASYLLV